MGSEAAFAVINEVPTGATEEGGREVQQEEGGRFEFVVGR